MSLQKIANVIPTAAVKQSAKVLGPLVFFAFAVTVWLVSEQKSYTLNISPCNLFGNILVSFFIAYAKLQYVCSTIIYISIFICRSRRVHEYHCMFQAPRPRNCVATRQNFQKRQWQLRNSPATRTWRTSEITINQRAPLALVVRMAA